MVVITPFCKMVCEFEAGRIRGCVFKIDHDKLFVGVLR